MTLLLALLPFLLQDADRVQDLIRKLGSEDYATREQASEELKKIGKPARPALQKAAEESDDPEVRQRAQALLDDKPAPDKAPAPRRAVPGMPGIRGSSVSVRTTNGDSTYTIKPAEDLPVLVFHKAAAGKVKLEYTDEKGDATSAEAATLDDFLKEQPELAKKFGITSDGIDYAGSRVSFKGRGIPEFAFPRFNGLPQQPRRVPPPPPAAPEEPGVPVAGAVLGDVDEALRAQLELPEGQGAVVLRVLPGGAAESLGLRKSDILLDVDGKKISSPESAKGLITRDSKLSVVRKGKRETLGGRKDF